VLHESLGAKLLAAAAETESRRRQIDVMRRDDDVKLTAARRENEALRQELDAIINGAKRTDVGLVSIARRSERGCAGVNMLTFLSKNTRRVCCIEERQCQ